MTGHTTGATVPGRHGIRSQTRDDARHGDKRRVRRNERKRTCELMDSCAPLLAISPPRIARHRSVFRSCQPEPLSEALRRAPKRRNTPKRHNARPCAGRGECSTVHSREGGACGDSQSGQPRTNGTRGSLPRASAIPETQDGSSGFRGPPTAQDRGGGRYHGDRSHQVVRTRPHWGPARLPRRPRRPGAIRGAESLDRRSHPQSNGGAQG